MQLLFKFIQRVKSRIIIVARSIFIKLVDVQQKNRITGAYVPKIEQMQLFLIYII